MRKRTGLLHRLLIWVSAIVVLAIADSGRAEDTVIVSHTDGRGQTRRKGLIQEYTGESLTLQLANGQVEEIPTKRIVGIETDKAPDHQNADQLRAEGRNGEALESYRRAVESEPRKWMRRQILAKMVRTYQDLGQFDRAGNAFLIIVRSDPTTQHFETIPLAWRSQRPSSELTRQAANWLSARDQPASVLLGASWLLSTDRDNAIAALRELTNNADPRVAWLAEAQRWRAQLVTASLDDVRRWQQQLSRMDPSLRGGPYFVVGQVLGRHGQHLESALTLMRIPILYPHQQDLVAESLFAAGEQLEQTDEVREARTIYRELVERHKQHPLSPLAQQRLDALPNVD